MTTPIANSSSPPAAALDSSAPAPMRLDYGLSASRRGKRIWRMVFLILAVGVGYVCWQWGPTVARQLPLLFWQRQCMHYTAAPTRVVYEEDPAEVKRLLAADAAQYIRYPLYRGVAANPTPVKAAAVTANFPNCWTRYVAMNPPASPWSAARLGVNSGAILFLHERISPAGHRRLVCIRYFPETYSFTTAFINGYNCDITVDTPATWTSPVAHANFPMSIDVMSAFPKSPPHVRIFAGQVDPSDASRFTIEYEMWGQRDTLRCQLRDDDRIALTPLRSPREP